MFTKFYYENLLWLNRNSNFLFFDIAFRHGKIFSLFIIQIHIMTIPYPSEKSPGKLFFTIPSQITQEIKNTFPTFEKDSKEFYLMFFVILSTWFFALIRPQVECSRKQISDLNLNLPVTIAFLNLFILLSIYLFIKKCLSCLRY